MHPAPSVILFTVLSGVGFGLLAFLGLGMPDVDGWVAFAFFFIGYALAVGGLMTSAFHLGNPQRALRAFTQWHTSWLSREAWLSVLALVLMGIYAIGVIFFDTRITWLGALAAALGLFTVFATSMIYGQLKTVPRWNIPLTPLYFLSLALAGGALLAGQVNLAGWLIVAVGVVQLATWWMGDAAFAASGHNLETATGLGFIGQVRQFEPPHTGTNYLLDEMVYVVGRKHAQKLRALALLFMVLIPVIILKALPFSHGLALVAILSYLIGVVASRWLFFAQAEHVVGLYYSAR